MIDIVFSKLLNSSHFVQRSLALAFTICVLLTALGFALGTIKHFRNQTVEIYLLREAIGNLKSIVDKRTAMIGDLDFRNADELIIKQSLVGETPAIARADLQTKLEEVASRTGSSIIALSNAQDIEDSSVKFIGISVRLSGNADAVHKTILALENSRPPLFFKNFSVLSNRAAQSVDRNIELTAKFDVYGAYSQPFEVQINGHVLTNNSVQGTL